MSGGATRVKRKGGPDAEGSMKKDNTWNVSVNTDKHGVMDDDAHLKVSYSPGKKGGNFSLPLGAKVTVPDGVFQKKDSITCEVAAPTKRWRYKPELPSYEHMTSEIFILSSSVHVLKKPIIVQLPYYQIDLEYNEINVKGRWKDTFEWVDIGFLKKEETSSPCVELEIDRLGTFIVTFTPKKEVFDITPQGCLYNARLSRYISIRVPKKSPDVAFKCSLQINPIRQEKITLAKEQFSVETSDLVHASEFIDLIPSNPVTFRRPITIKLPLPSGVEVEDDKNADVAVLVKNNNGWEYVESTYKFTKTTVTFDVKTLSRFCIAQAKTPERRKRLNLAMPILEGRTDKERGEILVFIHLQEKLWVMIVECCPQSQKDTRVLARKDKGFTHLNKHETVTEEPEKKHFRRAPPNEYKPKLPEGFEIFDGMKWKVNVDEDIQVSFENSSDYTDNNELQFFKYLPESYRRFVIEPKNNEERTLAGSVSFIPVGIDELRAKAAATLAFKVDIDEKAVLAYFHQEIIPEVPKKEKERPKIDFTIPEPVEEKPPVPTVQRFKPIPQTVMDRLMRSSRKPVIIEKESRVLSGRSLMSLAKVVPEGLTLAVHLDLPDSTITGLGFDAISNGLGMTNVTYKILLYWKRLQKDKKDTAVQILTMALRDMGRSDVANVVLERHNDNRDLTPDCFNIY